MNEAETRHELIDPKLKEAGWGEVEGSRLRLEYPITKGEIKPGGRRANPLKADYILIYKNRKLAVIEAKSDEVGYREGITQAKDYSDLLNLNFGYSTDGNDIYEIETHTNPDGKKTISFEGNITKFPSPDELWDKVFKESNEWEDKFNSIEYTQFKGDLEPRYYQEVAINEALKAISNEKDRILLTLATGTGKTVIAFHIAWKLFHSRWNIQRDGKRHPKILFLADRNILANQAFNSFGAFEENALVRIRPGEINQVGHVPTNGNIFFTIFQTFMSGPDDSEYYGEYPKDFFDLVIIDECHRGGARDESSWKNILNYFDSAVHIGLTATPKREVNADTYKYFGDPSYTYSLKQGIKDGFLTPFKVRRIQTTMDEYTYTSDDVIIQGEEELEQGRIYTRNEMNRTIEIKAREKKRVELMLENMNHHEKTLVFCANQDHANLIMNLINQTVPNPPIDYCVRVSADDGARGDTYLKQFQDNEKTTPTILTTSQKLSTGVDALNIRNIVIMRPINSMIEFKQIIGRGTRLFEGKSFFIIIDFENAYEMFNDDEWDGDPIEPTPPNDPPVTPPGPPPEPPIDPPPPRTKIKIKLSDSKEREIQSMSQTLFYYDGQPISSEEFIKKLFNTLNLPNFFSSEEELRGIWSSPLTRKTLLKKLNDNGFSKGDLKNIQELIEPKDSDLFDVLEFIAYAKKPISRIDRVSNAEEDLYKDLNDKQKDFIDFILDKYVEGGVEELDIQRLPDHLVLKFGSLDEGIKELGEVDYINKTFVDFQKHLYLQ